MNNEKIAAIVAEKTGFETKVSVVNKNNRKMTGVNVICGEVNPMFYIDGMPGETEEDVACNIVRRFERLEIPSLPVNIYEYCPERVFAKLLSIDNNKDYLDGAIYRKIGGNLALVVFINAGIMSDDMLSSIKLTPRLLKVFKVDEERVFADAIANLNNNVNDNFGVLDFLLGEEASIEELSSDKIICNLTDAKMQEYIDAESYMLIISNKEKLYGAAGILSKRFQNLLAGKFALIIPSSVHECLVMTRSCEISEEELQEAYGIVKMVNQTLPPEDILCDDVFYWNGKELSSFRYNERIAI